MCPHDDGRTRLGILIGGVVISSIVVVQFIVEVQTLDDAMS